MRGISFAVEPGELFGLLGPNGAGKTTTIKMLITLLIPTGGSARVLGLDVVRDAHDQARKQDDHGALDQLRPTGPLDLLQLAPGLGYEALDEKPRRAAPVVLARDGLGHRAHLRADPRALDRGLALGLRGAARAALGTGLACHD